ncbi:unnamed protein product [marine sediment metagenome]|uniref:Uncharacterized protein n=1 Tax=marine sediment metagenome TaxID=412755 RepID=X1CVJ0_9ZZZZ
MDKQQITEHHAAGDVEWVGTRVWIALGGAVTQFANAGKRLSGITHYKGNINRDDVSCIATSLDAVAAAEIELMPDGYSRELYASNNVFVWGSRCRERTFDGPSEALNRASALLWAVADHKERQDG